MATSLLLADDSPTIAKILGMALQSEDYEIRSALTAEDALKELHASPPFFFLVDLTLPGKNGYEFSRLIRADRKLKDVRILLLASAFDPADDNEVKACGADGVITKPFDPGELRRRLREVRDAPPKFMIGDVTGSLSGATVTSNNPPSAGHAAPANPETPPPAPPLSPPPPSALPEAESFLGQEESDPLSILAGSGDANSILGSALGDDSELPPPAPETTPVFDLRDADNRDEFTNATVLIDPSALLEAAENTPAQAVVDLSNSFATPPGGTNLIDTSGLQEPMPVLEPAPAAPPASPPADEPLSANAQALAAFFAAEIDAKEAAPASTPAPSEPAEDAFDASLSSIEWGAPKADLNDWSSAPPPKAAKPAPAETIPAATAPAPAKAAPASVAQAPARDFKRESPAPQREITHEISMDGLSAFAAPEMAPVRPQAATQPATKPQPAPVPTGASSEGGSFLFDTGGSNFRFAENYIQRITKAFTGNTDEMTLGRDASTPIFHKSSDDRPAPTSATAEPALEASTPAALEDPLEAKARHLPTGGGAWSPEEVKRIEQIVRDEVQMVVREIAEKVVWEVVPELAENLIRKELDKVLKEME